MLANACEGKNDQNHSFTFFFLLKINHTLLEKYYFVESGMYVIEKIIFSPYY